ncbi:uncharacterized protein LOC107262058 [Ricinus communis]|uniref:uncharacterized protein LOC107262058 n=1 Tax=Ricinus communis TaxID=3988 RepID=UPI00201A90ED|nr:uncharacterized protein LOC107262058 [Ricinus communis]
MPSRKTRSGDLSTQNLYNLRLVVNKAEEDQEVESEFVILKEEEELEDKLEEGFEEEVQIMANEQRQVATERQIAMKDYARLIIGNTVSYIVLVNINLPLLDIIRSMHVYAKFFKVLKSNKRRYEINEKVIVSQTVCVVLQQQLDPKMKVPKSFIVDITMRDKKFVKAMLDLRASINLMSYSIYVQLGLGELKPTTMSLQLADRSIKYARDVVEDFVDSVDSPIENQIEIINEPPKFELKELSNKLKYVFLGEENTYTVIVASDLCPSKEKATSKELRRLKKAIG